MLEILVAAGLAAQGQPQAADAPRPRDPDDYAPWLAEQEIRPGDRWYRVRLDLDARGRVTRCRMAASNDRNNERRFWTCRAFMGGAFETAPVMRDGVAVAGSIERTVIMPGRNSRNAYERARQEHRRQRRD